jgi:hypothetical protein
MLLLLLLLLMACSGSDSRAPRLQVGRGKKNNKPVDGSMTDSRILCLIHSSAVAVLTQHKSLLGEIEN